MTDRRSEAATVTVKARSPPKAPGAQEDDDDDDEDEDDDNKSEPINSE